MFALEIITFSLAMKGRNNNYLTILVMMLMQISVKSSDRIIPCFLGPSSLTPFLYLISVSIFLCSSFENTKW